MYIFDLEGTLSDSRHRIEHHKNQNWDEWNAQFPADPVRGDIKFLFEVCSQIGPTIILTSKEERYRADVEIWLSDNDIHPDLLVMKKTGSKETSPMFKSRMLKYVMLVDEIKLVVDDRLDIINELSKQGIPTLWVGDRDEY